MERAPLLGRDHVKRSGREPDRRRAELRMPDLVRAMGNLDRRGMSARCRLSSKP